MADYQREGGSVGAIWRRLERYKLLLTVVSLSGGILASFGMGDPVGWLVEKIADNAAPAIVEEMKPVIAAEIDRALEAKLAVFGVDLESTPPVRFAVEGHKLQDGRPGEWVLLSLPLVKSRDCGRPLVNLVVLNGNGALHQLQPEDISIADSTGRGVSMPVDPMMMQVLRYYVRLPDGVHAGDATITGQLDYRDQCPAVDVVRFPLVRFRILDG